METIALCRSFALQIGIVLPVFSFGNNTVLAYFLCSLFLCSFFHFLFLVFHHCDSLY